MRIFASERVSQMMLKLGMEEGIPIEHGMVTCHCQRSEKSRGRTTSKSINSSSNTTM